MLDASSTHCELSFGHTTLSCLHVQLIGNWTLQADLPSPSSVQQELADSQRPTQFTQLSFDTQQLTNWDSGLLTFLLRLHAECEQQNIEFDPSGLPEGVQRLLQLATAVPERKGARREASSEPFLARIGKDVSASLAGATEMLSFLGQIVIAFVRLLRGKARFRRSDLALLMQQCGAQALPIISLISFLVGLILAFVGAVQLEQFGAQIYVADGPT